MGHRWAEGSIACAALLGVAIAGGPAAHAGPPAPADVTALKTVSGTFEEGALVTYTVEVTNGGTVATGDNLGDELVDVLPAALTLVSAFATSGTATTDIPANTVRWNGAINGGASVTITITAAVDEQTEGDTAANQASISFDSDNDGTHDTQVSSDDVAGAPIEPTSFVVAAIAPTVTINQALTQPDPASGEPVRFAVVFSEPVAGFAADDVVITGTAGATGVTVIGSGTTFTVEVDGASTPGTIIATIPAGAAIDDDGIDSAAATFTDNEVDLAAIGSTSTTSTSFASATTASTLGSTTTAAASGTGSLPRTGSSDDGPAVAFLGWWVAMGGLGVTAYAAARRHQLRSARR